MLLFIKAFKPSEHPRGDGGKFVSSGLPSSAHIKTAEEARSYWQDHLAGRTIHLQVQVKSGVYPVVVTFDGANTHMWTRAARPGEDPDAFDQPEKRIGPRVFDGDRAHLMEHLLPSVEKPWKVLGQQGRDVYIGARMDDGQTYTVILEPDKQGEAGFVSAHPRSAASVQKLITELRPVVPAKHPAQKRKPLLKGALHLDGSVIAPRICRIGDSVGHPRSRSDSHRTSLPGTLAPLVAKASLPAALAKSTAAAQVDRAQSVLRWHSGEPTRAQIEAGNYPKRVVEWRGLQIRVENEPGSVRRGVDPGGKAWETRMHAAYGYVVGSMGVDGDPVDVYLGPALDTAEFVYVVHQRRVGRWDEFDEDKVMAGYASEDEARHAFLLHYNDERFLGDVTAMPVDEFVAKVRATAGRLAMIKARGASAPASLVWLSRPQ